MKIFYIFSLLLLINCSLQSMNTSQYVLNDNIRDYVHKCFKDKKWDLTPILRKSMAITDSTHAALKAIETYRDEQGNTIAHLLVMHKQPSMLFDYAKAELISSATNNNGRTACDLAVYNLSAYTKSDEFKNKELPKLIAEKCCYSILVNHEKYSTAFLGNWDEPFDLKHCCSEHIFENRRHILGLIYWFIGYPLVVILLATAFPK